MPYKQIDRRTLDKKAINPSALGQIPPIDINITDSSKDLRAKIISWVQSLESWRLNAQSVLEHALMAIKNSDAEKLNTDWINQKIQELIKDHTIQVNLDNYLPKTGGTVTGPIYYNGEIVFSNQLATKDYVDQKINEIPIKQGYRIFISTPSEEWIINHNLGRVPIVQVRNEDGAVVMAYIKPLDNNRVYINVKPAMRGWVECI